MENTEHTTDSNINQEGPFFYAVAAGNSKRVAERFNAIFSANNSNVAEFVGLSNVPKYRAAVDALLYACKDHGLDRNGMTRSQIVMAYNKAQKPLKLIEKYVEINGVQALYDNIIAANVSTDANVLDVRINIVKACA